MTPQERILKIHHFLSTIFQPGDLIEVQGLGSDHDGTLRLLTSDFLLAARTALGMEKRGADVYFALNPVNPASKYAQRATKDEPQRRVRRGMTVSARDIASRNTYLVDVDPRRPSGTAASTEQRAAGRATAHQVRDYLATREWPEPILIDSGNGGHLLYRGDRCSADGDTLALALKTLNDKFGDTCAIDASVHNPNRISRMPYTLNKKAGRMSSVISYPLQWVPVMHGKIYSLAIAGGHYREDYGTRRAVTEKTELLIDEDGVHALIDEYPKILDLDRVTYEGDITYFALASCPFKGGPHRGQDVGAGKTAIILRPDGIGFKCFSDDCADHGFVDLLRLLHKQTGHGHLYPYGRNRMTWRTWRRNGAASSLLGSRWTRKSRSTRPRWSACFMPSSSMK